MAQKTPKKPAELEVVTPLGLRVLIRKEDDKKETKGGIVLPDDSKIPTITARILAISDQVGHDINYPINLYDKVLVNPIRAIPVDFEEVKNFIIPIEDVIAIIGKKE